MKPSQVLKQMNELRETWRKQNFSWYKDQEIEYNKLRKLRWERVKEMYDQGLVHRGSKTTTDDK